MSRTTHPFPPQQRTLLSMAVALAVSQYGAALAAPVGHQVVAGQVAVTAPTAQQTVITQSTPAAIVNWQQFSIGAAEHVDIRQPSAASVLLNRVIGNNPSEIYGRLSANGQVFLVNPNGVLFGRNAQVSVGALVASTLDIANDDFLAGRYQFAGNSGAAVSNQGSLQAAERGTVALLGARVNNDGTISAQLGTAALAAGEKIALDFQGDGLTKIRVDRGAVAALVANHGLIVADGGQAVMTAHAAQALADTVLNQEGVIRARSLVERDGKIVLDGGAHGVTLNSGVLDATGTAGLTGGAVQVLGHHVALTGAALVDASGGAGGGMLEVGGSAHGANPLVRNAAATFAGPQAVLRADATLGGDGGNIIVWSENATRMFGAASARGAGHGKGGFIETSGKFLDVAGARIDAGAGSGRSGTWLLDPYDVDIVDVVTGPTMGGNPNFVSDANSTTLSTSLINAALNSNTSVSVTTGAGGEQSGDIRIDGNIARTAGAQTATLTFNAAGAITINPGKSITSDAGKLNVDFNADADGAGGGHIYFDEGARIATNGGSVRLYGQGNPGTGFATGSSVAFPDGVTLQGATIDTSAAGTAGGDVSIRGMSVVSSATGNTASSSSAGVRLDNATIVSGGALAVTGIGSEGASGVVISSGTLSAVAGGAIDIRGRSSDAGDESGAAGVGLNTDDAVIFTGTGAGAITLSGQSANGAGMVLGGGTSIGGASDSSVITLRALNAPGPSEGSTPQMLELGASILTSGWIDLQAGGVSNTGELTAAPGTGALIAAEAPPQSSVFFVQNADLAALLDAGNRVSLSAPGDIDIRADVVKTAGGHSAVRLNAGNDVNLQSVSIAATGAGKLDVDFNPDADSSGGGTISVYGLSSILTNGGNLRFYGQSDPLAGFVTGSTSTWTEAIYIDSATIDTTSANAGVAGGDITMRGRGIAVIGSGEGEGEGGLDSGEGVTISASILRSGSGSISLTGIAGDGSDGVYISGGEIAARAGGSIDIRGRGALPDVAGQSYANGVNLRGVRIATGGGAGKIVISGEAIDAAGVATDSDTVIGDESTTGNITVRSFSTAPTVATAPMIALGGRITTSGVVNLRPGGVSNSGTLTDNLNVAIDIQSDTPVRTDIPREGGLDDDAPREFAPGSFGLRQGWLTGVVQPGAAALTIGSATHTGAISVTTTAPLMASTHLTLQNGGVGSEGIFLGSGSALGSYQLTLSSGGSVTQGAPLAAGALLLHGSGPGANFQLADPGNVVNRLGVRFNGPKGSGALDGSVAFANTGNLELASLAGVGFDGATNLGEPIRGVDSVFVGNTDIKTSGTLTVADRLTMLADSATFRLDASNDLLLNARFGMIGSGNTVTFGAGRDLAINAALGLAGDGTRLTLTGQRDLALSANLDSSGQNFLFAANAARNVDLDADIGVVGNNSATSVTAAGALSMTEDVTVQGDRATVGLNAATTLNVAGTIFTVGDDASIIYRSQNDVLVGGAITMFGDRSSLLLESVSSDITLAGRVNFAGSSAKAMLSAGRDIGLTPTARIVADAVKGPLTLDFNADADSVNGGAIAMGAGSQVYSNGGSVRLYGQGDALAGFASGSPNAGAHGVSLTGATIDTRNADGTGGSITVRGKGAAGGAGVFMDQASVASGGAIAIAGVGGAGGSGVALPSTWVYTTGGGAIDIRGRAGAAGSTAGGSGVLANNSGIYTNGGVGDIMISGEAGEGAGIALGSASFVGNNATSGNVIVRAFNTAQGTGGAPMLDLGATLHTTGVVNLRPGGVSDRGALTDKADVVIAIGGAAPAGSFALSQETIGSFVRPEVSTLVIGSATHTGAIGVTASGPFGATYDVTLQNGGAGSGGITLYNGLDIGGRMLTMSSGGRVIQAGPISAASLLVHGTGPLSSFQLADGGNAVTRFSSHFDAAKGPAPTDGDVNFYTAGNLEVAPLTGFGMDASANAPQSIVSASAIIAGDVVLRAGGQLTLRENIATLGSDITLVAGGRFLNPVNATLTPGGGGRWLVFADTWLGEQDGGLTGTGAIRNLYNCAYGDACASALPAIGNAFVYAQQPRLDLALVAPSQSRVYGSANPAFAYAAIGLVKGDELATALSGNYGTAALQGSDVGNYAVDGSFTSALGYLVAAAPGNITVTPATLTYVATPVTRTSGAPNPEFAGGVTGLVNGDTLISAATGTMSFASNAPLVTAPGQYAIDGAGLTARNYVFVQAALNATALSVQAAPPVPPPQPPLPPVTPPPEPPPPVTLPPVIPPLLFSLLHGVAPNTGYEVEMASSDLYGRNFGTQRACVGSGPLAGGAGGGGAEDLLATEWSRVRGTPNLSNCIGMVQRYSCGDF